MAKEPKAPKGSTMEERWAEEDQQAPFGFNPNTGEPNVVEDIGDEELEEIEAELSDGDEETEAD